MPSKLLVAGDLVIGHQDLLRTNPRLARGNPRTEDEYIEIAMAAARAAQRGALVISPRQLIAYVNDGRWIADCPHCRAGMMLDPEWTRFPCLGAGCYRLYSDVLWPPNVRAIEEALYRRPMRNQHWGTERGTKRDPGLPVETVDDLEQDNGRHGDELDVIEFNPRGGPR